MRTTAKAHPDAEGLHAAIVARAGLEQLSRERVRMELMKLMLAPHAVPALAVMAEAGLLGLVLGGVPHLASFANMAKVEAACGLAPDATRRLGALGVWIAEDAERLWQRLRLSNAEHERLAAMGDGWWRVSPAMGEAAARELIYRSGRNISPIACCSPGRARRRARTTTRGARLRRCRSAGPRRRFRCAPRISSRAAWRRARSLGAALARAEAAWIASGFPMERKALDRDHQ